VNKLRTISLVQTPPGPQGIELASYSTRRTPSYVFERIYEQLNGLSFRFDTHHQRTIYQAPAWLHFLAKTQHGEPVIAALKEGQETIGHFTGLVVRKFGIRILGSPFPGWSTDYMGLTLAPHVNRRLAIKALMDLAFGQLKCAHLEIMDRHIVEADLYGMGAQCQHRLYHSYEIDLTRNEDELFANMKSACRRCIRKASKEGVYIEEARDLGFADDYYAQLQDVFAKQTLIPTYGIERVRNLIQGLHPLGQLLLLRARDRHDRCIATGVFPYLNGVMYFWGGASWRRFNTLRPNEAIQWYAMKFAKRNGIRIYDMGGSGIYKKKYGGKEIEVPWFGISKYPWVRYLRDMARKSYKARQRCLGQFNRLFCLPMAHASEK
jgi:hypothetical protein